MHMLCTFDARAIATANVTSMIGLLHYNMSSRISNIMAQLHVQHNILQLSDVDTCFNLQANAALGYG